MAESHPVWGIIIPLDASISGKLELRENTYLFGTGTDCDYEIIYPLPDSCQYLQQYSHHHFRIEKEYTETESCIFIHDLSDSGTFVNGKKIGKNYKRFLDPDAEISLVHPDNKAFIYIVEKQRALQDIPEVIRSSYIVSKKLGRGAFGEVRLLFTPDGSAKVAMKCVDKFCYRDQSDHTILKEIDIMVKLKHPCIIEVIEAHSTPTCLYIIMELADSGTLNTRLKQQGRLDEEVTKLIIYQILMAVDYLHQKGITHRDLKPDNILLMSGEAETLVKVTDFGVSKVLDPGTLMKTLAGTPCYIAPEVWKHQILSGKYSSAVDVWAVGIILYQCLIGDLPVKALGRGHHRSDLYETFKVQSKFDTQEWDQLPLAEDIGRRLLKVDPAERIGTHDALRHLWFQDDRLKGRILELTGLLVEEEDSGYNSTMDRSPDQNVSPQVVPVTWYPSYQSAV